MQLEQVIRRPIIFTEKGTTLRDEENKYLFEVSLKSSKVDVKRAVEMFFNVKVTDVNTMIVRGKMKRMGRGAAKRRNWKKAIVALQDGDTIDPLEGF